MIEAIDRVYDILEQVLDFMKATNTRLNCIEDRLKELEAGE